jgi:glycerol kinase
VSSVTEATVRGAGFLAGCEVGQWSDLADTAELTADGRLVEPAGPPGISRGRWAEAVDRARGWIPELSALDF